MNIMVLNAGSSSLKYQLLDMNGEKSLAKGSVERIGIEGSMLTHKVGDRTFKREQQIKDHKESIQLILEALVDPEMGALKSMDEIVAIGHRVLHGSERFTGSVQITEDVKEAIRENIPLGPLHNPANLIGIEACEKVMPSTSNIAVFDTAFHQTMPEHAYLYAIPKDYYERLRIRRYGFHGTSHRYVSERVCAFLGLDRRQTRVITVHLGNGSSLAAVDCGKCVDTSMGLTPLEGVMMGTRSGSLDPAVVQFIANSDDQSVDEVLDILNKKSSLLGVSGMSSDGRDIEDLCLAGNEDALRARAMLHHTIRKHIGSYIAVMGGVDVVVFTAGIGENDKVMRKDIMQSFEYMGAKIDDERNNHANRKEAIISTEDSAVKIAVIPTNEEIVIARDTLAIIARKPVGMSCGETPERGQEAHIGLK